MRSGPSVVRGVLRLDLARLVVGVIALEVVTTTRGTMDTQDMSTPASAQTLPGRDRPEGVDMSERTCVEVNCERQHYGRGWCKMHYLRAWTQGRVEDQPRSMVAAGASLNERLRHHGWTVMPSGCWEWKGSLNGGGYGQLAVGTDRPEIATRVAYRAWVGPIPAGGAICHRCDNPPCINPAHLFLGTKADNNRDMRTKDRHAHGETSTAWKLTDVQVVEIRTRYAAGGVTQRALAEEFGVSTGNIQLIIARKRRKSSTYAAHGGIGG